MQNCYLMAQFDPDLQEIHFENIREYGLTSPSSRLSQANCDIFEDVENIICREFSTEDAVLFSTGFTSGAAVMSTISKYAKRKNLDIVIHGANHPCTHAFSGSFENQKGDECGLHHILRRRQSSGASSGWAVIFDHINPSYGCPNFDQQSEIIQKSKVKICDISHSAFCISPEEMKDFDIVFGSLNKAASFHAGFVSGPKDFCELTRLVPEYKFSAPPALSSCATFFSGLPILLELRRQLEEKIEVFDDFLEASRGVKFPIYGLTFRDDFSRSVLTKSKSAHSFSQKGGNDFGFWILPKTDIQEICREMKDSPRPILKNMPPRRDWKFSLI